MDALFIGHTYIDVTIMTDHVPTGDDKDVATEYAVSFGGNAVTAAFCCAKLGLKPDLVATGADDWLGDMFRDTARKYEVELHIRKVRRSSLSFVMLHGAERAILRARDDRYLHPFPHLDITGCRVLHIDGHQPDAALHYARACREAGILTSLDGGGVHNNTHEVLSYIDVAIVSERFSHQLKLSPEQTLDYLAERGCRIGGVTFGERGLFWYDERGRRHAPRPAGAGAARHRHERRRRRVSQRLRVFLFGRSAKALDRPFPFCACRGGLQGAAARQRGGTADHRRCCGLGSRIQPGRGEV
jgi:sugar/nucleoside kinase (ribokinase family)